MFSQITLVGNLGSSPELRYTSSGVPVVSFSLAVNKSWKDATGNKQERTNWYRISCWRKLAETVAQYCTKGQRVLVVGEDIEARPYTNRNGEQAVSLEVTANVVRFLSSKSETDAPWEPMGSGADQPPPAPVEDSEIPF